MRVPAAEGRPGGAREVGGAGDPHVNPKLAGTVHVTSTYGPVLP